jgi:hypothetical protein
VTEYDVRVEELVRHEIARAYPHFQLYAYPFRRSPFESAECATYAFCFIALAKNRTPLGPVLRSRIHRPSVSILSVSFLLLTPTPPPPHFLPRGTGTHCTETHAMHLPRRRHDQLRTRLPLRMHLHRPNRPPRPSPRGDLQPFPRTPLHRHTQRRLLPPRPHPRTHRKGLYYL